MPYKTGIPDAFLYPKYRQISAIFHISGVDTAKNVCYNGGESGKAHAADPTEFAAKGRRLCVDISHSGRSKTLDCTMFRGHSPFAD